MANPAPLERAIAVVCLADKISGSFYVQQASSHFAQHGGEYGTGFLCTPPTLPALPFAFAVPSAKSTDATIDFDGDGNDDTFQYIGCRQLPFSGSGLTQDAHQVDSPAVRDIQCVWETSGASCEQYTNRKALVESTTRRVVLLCVDYSVGILNVSH